MLPRFFENWVKKLRSPAHRIPVRPRVRSGLVRAQSPCRSYAAVPFLLRFFDELARSQSVCGVGKHAATADLASWRPKLIETGLA